MQASSIKLIFCLLFVALLSGCTLATSIQKHYESNFAYLKFPEIDLVKKGPFNTRYQRSFDEVWDTALFVLSQHAVIINASKGSGMITYLVIDGVFSIDKYIYWEFPFAVLIERETDGASVYVYPMINLFDSRDYNKEWWSAMNNGFNQKGEEVIEKLSVQLMVEQRWQWLRN